MAEVFEKRANSASAQVKAVLFDLDGTLLDTYQLILSSMRYTIQTVLGQDLPDERLMEKVGQPLVTQLADFADDPEMVEKLVSVYREHNEKHHDSVVRAFAGMRETLEALKGAGLVLGVVTSKRHELAQRGLDIAGLAPYMSFVVGPDDWPEHKPAPGSVLHGCRLAGFDASECAYVGDSPFDLQAGNGAGCFTVAVLWGMFDEAVLRAQQPDAVCAEPHEIVELFV